MPLNILVIMTDQLRADHCGFLPGAKVDTPNLDLLAGSGSFSNCITANPICTPARCALLTGKYTHQIGMVAMSGELSPQHPTYPRALQQAGYHTMGVGKFHFWQGWPWGQARGEGYDLTALTADAEAYGFDQVWEAAGKQLAVRSRCEHYAHLENKGLGDPYRDFVESEGKNSKQAAATVFTGKPWPFADEDYVDHMITDQVIHHLRERPKGKPFLMFASLCSPHPPFDPPARYLDGVLYEEVDDFIPTDPPMDMETKKRLWRMRRAYRALVLMIDTQVGRMLAALREEGVFDDTMIVFTTDHGEMLGDHGCMQKQSYYASSARIPLAIRHPHYLTETPRVIPAPVELTDVTATILDAAGLDPQASLSLPWPAFNNRVPARSLLPILRGETERVRDIAFSECQDEWQMLQSDRHKYVRLVQSDGPNEKLFDLQNDPDELADLASDPEQADTLAWFRQQREALIDRTPPAQLNCLPLQW